MKKDKKKKDKRETIYTRGINKRETIYTRDVNIKNDSKEIKKEKFWQVFWQVVIILAIATVCFFVVYSISLAKDLL